MRKLLGLLMVAAIVITVSGCNTVKGAGQDVESAGRGLKKVAEKND